MGLRCLLGHDFGEPETEREREEEGNEVVVSVREVKTCQTCGETRVVSENKEIKSIEQLRQSAMGESPRSGGDDGRFGGARDVSPGVADSGRPEETRPGAADEADRGVADIIADAERPVDDADPEGVDESTPADRGVDDGPTAESTSTDVDPTDAGPTVSGPIDAGEDDREEPYNVGTDPSGDAADSSAGTDEMPTHPAEREAPAGDEDVDPADEDAVILDDESDEPAAGREQWEETADPEDLPGADDAADERDEREVDPADEAEAPPDEDDAVIMDDEPAPRTEEGYTPWPEPEGADEGHDAGVPDGESVGVDFGGGLAPASDEATADSVDATDATTPEAEDGTDAPTDAGRTAADPARNGAARNGTTAGETAGRENAAPRAAPLNLERAASDAAMEYHCPDCGLRRAVGNSSMRAGDICPECHRGYITERERRD